MAKDSIRKVDLDINALRKAIRATEPEEISYKEVLSTVRADLEDRVGKGVTVEGLAKTLKSHGIVISARSLRAFLENEEGATNAPETHPAASATDELGQQPEPLFSAGPSATDG